MKYILYFFFSVLLLACKNNFEREELDLESIPFLIDTIVLNEGAACRIETPLINNHKLMLFITNKETGEAWIDCYDIISLEFLWRWDEAMKEFGSSAKGFGENSYVYEGVLTIEQSNLSYGINIETGQTIWKNKDIDVSKSYVAGCKNLITNNQIIDQKTHQKIRYADIENGLWRDAYEYFKDDSLDIDLSLPILISWKDKDYITFISSKWKAGFQDRHHKLNLYNLSENMMEWVSDTIPLSFSLSGTPGVLPSFIDGQILLGNDAIYSYNIEDGSLEWMKWYGNSFVLNNNLTVGDGTVYGNNQFFIVGLDVHTGEELFKTTTGGSTSTIAYHDGKCYMSAVTGTGNTDRLMVIDGTSGEVLHDVGSPFLEESRQWHFESSIAVDSETGLVYTSDHRYLLVYDFDE